MKQYLINKVKGKLSKEYFEIKEDNNNNLHFNLKNKSRGKKELILKNRVTGKRLVKPIKNSMATISSEDLQRIREYGNYDIYIRTTILNRKKIKRAVFVPQNRNKKIICNDNYTFESFPTINENLSFLLKKHYFSYDILSIDQKNHEFEVSGELFPFKNVKLDEVEIAGWSNKGGRITIPCNYEISDEKVTFKSNLYIDFNDEQDLNGSWKLEIRIKNDELVIDSQILRVFNLNEYKTNLDYYLKKIEYDTDLEDDIKPCLFYYQTKKFDLKFQLISVDKYNDIVSIAKKRDFYNKAKENEKIQDNLVFFESFHGKYNNSPKYIYEKMLELGYDKKYSFVWSYDGDYEIPGNPIITNSEEEDYYTYLVKSKYKVNNATFSIIDKNSDKIYLQTWHGTPLKRLGYDIENNTGVGWRHFNKESKTWNYLVSANSYSTKTFKRAFKYKKPVLEFGYPTNDIFYQDNTETIKSIKNNLNIPKDKKIILYAPTFRDNKINEKGERYFDLEIDLKKFYEELKDEYILILKLHSAVSKSLELSDEFKDFAYDLTDYDDIHELYIISDILLTDYSSVFFDFAHSKKPILFFTPDLEEYVNSRGVYQEIINDLPGPQLINEDSILDNIKNIENYKEENEDKYNKFYEKYCSSGHGDASEQIIKEVFGRV